MNKTLLLAIAATVSANTWAGTDHLVVKLEKEWTKAAVKVCARGAHSYTEDETAVWGGPWGSPQAEAYADAWAKALALVKVKAKAEADFAIYRNTPKGLVKNVNFNAALSSSSMTVALAEGTAEAIGAGSSASYAVSIPGKPWKAGAAAIGSGFGEGFGLGDAAAGSIAGSLSQALSKVSVNTYGVKQFKTGLLMGNHTYAASAAEAEAVASALAKTFVVAMTWYRHFGDVSIDVSADHDYAAADAFAQAFAAALAQGSVVASVQASYDMGGFAGKRGKRTEHFSLTSDAKMWLGCIAKADADTSFTDVEAGPTKAEEVAEY